MLKRVDTLVTSLDKNKGNITAALDGVNRLAVTLATRKQDVGQILTGLSPGLKVLEQQRASLLTMLRALGTLSKVAVDTINKSKADTLADLKALAPTLKALADSGQALPDSLQVLLTYPFTDEVLRGVKGDYLNVYLDVTAVPGTTIIPEYRPDDQKPAARTGSSGAAPAPLPLPSVTGSAGTTGPSGAAGSAGEGNN
jgi:phospholipid/cholesterol/gamma-HCH transport system substrate-binding protein